MAMDYEYQREISDMLRKEFERIPEMRQGLEDIFGKQSELYRTQFGNKREELGFKTNESIFDFMTQYQGAQSKGGFSGSGALERGRERGMGSLQKGYEFGQQSLFDTLQERKLGAQKEYWSGMSDLDKYGMDLRMQAASLDTKEPGFLDRMSTVLTDPANSWKDMYESIFK